MRRDIEEIARDLGADTTRPAYGEDVRDVYARREPLFSSCSHYQFFMQKGDHDVTRLELEFARFIAVVTNANPHIPRSQTFFLSLTFPDLSTPEKEGLLHKVGAKTTDRVRGGARRSRVLAT